MLKKIVNGQEIICSPQEEALIRADWERNITKEDTRKNKKDATNNWLDFQQWLFADKTRIDKLQALIEGK